ncbi:hypothetical protein THAOC_15384, partial [Thalassiosira oceanica]
MVSEAEAQGKPLHDKQCINLKPDSFRVTLVERSTAHEKDSSIEVAEGSEEEYICPGYESTLQELLTMAQTRDQRCSPTAVVISGCPGVGKTRMVRPRSNLIAQNSFSDPVRLNHRSVGQERAARRVSPRDIRRQRDGLLQEASDHRRSGCPHRRWRSCNQRKSRVRAAPGPQLDRQAHRQDNERAERRWDLHSGDHPCNVGPAPAAAGEGREVRAGRRDAAPDALPAPGR